jgi:hypothetical protein
MGLTIKYHGQHTSRAGNLTYRYTVEGTKPELAKFKKLQGQYYKETSKAEGSQPIYFTNQFPGNTASLKFVNKGVIIDNEELNKQIGAVKAAGGDLGAALAKSVADKLTAGMNFGNVSEDDSSLTPDSSVKIDDLGS